MSECFPLTKIFGLTPSPGLIRFVRVDPAGGGQGWGPTSPLLPPPNGEQAQSVHARTRETRH
jgi:hypothetical protein